jgi:phage gp46-like protein
MDIEFNDDIRIVNSDLAIDSTLYNCYQTSILTNYNKFWADNSLGSKLYTLDGETVINQDVLDEFEGYLNESIQWIKDQQLVLDHVVTVYQDNTAIKFTNVVTLLDGSQYTIGQEA